MKSIQTIIWITHMNNTSFTICNRPACMLRWAALNSCYTGSYSVRIIISLAENGLRTDAVTCNGQWIVVARLVGAQQLHASWRAELLHVRYYVISLRFRLWAVNNVTILITGSFSGTKSHFKICISVEFQQDLLPALPESSEFGIHNMHGVRFSFETVAIT